MTCVRYRKHAMTTNPAGLIIGSIEMEPTNGARRLNFRSVSTRRTHSTWASLSPIPLYDAHVILLIFYRKSTPHLAILSQFDVRIESTISTTECHAMNRNGKPVICTTKRARNIHSQFRNRLKNSFSLICVTA